MLFLICPLQYHILNHDLRRAVLWLLKYLRRVESSCRWFSFCHFIYRESSFTGRNDCAHDWAVKIHDQAYRISKRLDQELRYYEITANFTFWANEIVINPHTCRYSRVHFHILFNNFIGRKSQKGKKAATKMSAIDQKREHTEGTL